MVSSVADSGGTREKRVEIVYDRYDTGSGSGTIYWRGSLTSFAQDSDEVAGPVWQLYSGSFLTNNRFLQIMVEV